MFRILPFILLNAFCSILATCPTGWVSGPSACYLFIASNGPDTSWMDAESDCVAKGAHLASIHDGFTNSFLQQQGNKIFGPDNMLGLFIGQTTMILEGLWMWTDMSDTDYHNWDFGNGQPTGNSGTLCAALDLINSGKWESVDCYNVPYHHVCELPKTPSPCPPMPNIKNSELGPKKGAKWVNEHAGAIWKYEQSTKKCYLFLANKNPGLPTFSDARKTCQKYGATDLVSIGSDQENKVIGDNVMPFSIATGWRNNDAAMIGFFNNGTGWTWVNGQPLSYSNWNPNPRPTVQPKNKYDPSGAGWAQLMYGYLDGYKSKWNVGGKFDRGCSIFVCEKAIN